MLIFKAPVTVIGGGIAGLWIYKTLWSRGIPTLLVESHQIGGGQTLASQGMIHGGQKYTLQARNTPQAELLKNMPDRWNAALEGQVNSIDLSETQILSQTQVLWTTSWLDSITGFFASKSMQSRVTAVHETRPPLLTNPKFKGQVFELKEKVVNVSSLIHNLIGEGKGTIFGHFPHIERSSDGAIRYLCGQVDNQAAQIESDCFIFTAGSGNESYIQKLGNQQTQVRPIKQSIIKGDLPPIFGHCITADPRPRITITTHKTQNNETVWYLGGLTAEKTQNMSEEDSRALVQSELNKIFPWYQWPENLEIGFVNKNRAEIASSGLLSTGPQIRSEKNWTMIWPTKMTYAPILSDKVETLCQEINFQTSFHWNPTNLKIGKQPWDECEWKPFTI